MLSFFNNTIYNHYCNVLFYENDQLQQLAVKNNQPMNTLIDNVTKFVTTVLDLYSPLPFQLCADLHTLNAYLRSYSQSQEKLLENFVRRIQDKLEKKIKGSTVKQFDFNLDHLDKISSNKENYLQNNDNSQFSQSKGKKSNKENQFQIKTARDNLISKSQKKISNKINHEGLDITFKIEKHSSDIHEINNKNIENRLKNIKSQSEFSNLPISLINNRNSSQDKFMKQKKLNSKYEGSNNSIEKHRNNSSSSSLKIKLKPRASQQSCNMKQNIRQLSGILVANTLELQSYYRIVFGEDIINQKQCNL